MTEKDTVKMMLYIKMDALCKHKEPKTIEQHQRHLLEEWMTQGNWRSPISKHINPRAFHSPNKSVFFISCIPHYLYMDIKSINHFYFRLCGGFSLHQSIGCTCQFTHNILHEHFCLTALSFPPGIQTPCETCMRIHRYWSLNIPLFHFHPPSLSFSFLLHSEFLH